MFTSYIMSLSLVYEPHEIKDLTTLIPCCISRAETEPGAQKELNKIVDWQMRAKIDLLEIAVPKTRFESLFFLFFVLQKKIIILIF